MRIALGVEYAGWNYSGFQRQNHVNAVQNELEKALSQIADEEVLVYCAGRTDTGVSATGQVIHFDVTKDRPDRAWMLGTNTKLPDDIAITWARHVDDDFHARFSARARRYRYILQNCDFRPAILSKGVSTYRGEYNVELMHEAAQILIGENDFSSFKSSQDENPHAMRNMHFINVNRYGRYIVFDLQANAFLHHMVRNIVGSLLLVGNKERDIDWFKEVFAAKNREVAGPTAFPDGLYLVKVTYPEEFNLPIRDEDMGPLWLPV